MKILPVTSSEAVAAACSQLNANGVIVAPTETVYGIMARWDSLVARERIYALKRRPANKLLQMLTSDVAAVSAIYPLLNLPWIQSIADAFWPGPLTLIVETETCETIGIRVPDHPFVLSVLRALRSPLAATSANLSGRVPAITPEDAVRELDGEPDLLIDGGIVTVTGGTASTVASIVSGQLSIIREGKITLADLENVIHK